MKISFRSVGKSNEAYVKDGISDFTKRIGRYFPVEWKFYPVPKNSQHLPTEGQKKKEAEIVLSTIHPDDFLIVLDEKGKQFNSVALAEFLQARANESRKQVIFLIGGAFGVADAVLQRADFTWSLSKLVFPHQLVRLILAEQVYRACTILNNEKYHHE
ncbi:MAG TPA: 23S rRNA (pseudouridine(1915)-N(3))-methyltransferase RlmH [Chitinophagaceae bacterium]|nr:23S rRNA (pseudouridine(1915)-N(3))-methyltransferase RlmH [Chitinophagaceae bacterium]